MMYRQTERRQGQLLLVEDNLKLNEINRRALEGAGYTVHTALTLAQAQAYLDEHTPDIILLDVLLPDGNGIAFCQEMRGRTDAHILFLTSRSEDVDRIEGLVSGGDDYITKPYKLEELIARVDAAMRRRHMSRQPTRYFDLGKLNMDLATGRAYWDEVDLLLGQKEFALLLLLAQARGENVSKEQLYEQAWGQPLMEDGNALWKQISRLKQKLEKASGGHAVIIVTRGEGYALDLMA